MFVAVRIRPLLTFEEAGEEGGAGGKAAGNTWDINGKTGSINVNGPDEHTFAFDTVYQHPTSHEDIYNSCAASVVDGCLSGFNGTVFAYGQTGSGKTHTMQGVAKDPGIIPRAFNHIFRRAAAITEEGSDSFAVRVSYLEIYNERCRDLLSDTPSEHLKVREDQKNNRGFFVENLTYVAVHSTESALRWLEEGGSKRATAATSMNDESSRSHAIFTLVVERTFSDDRTISGKLSLVDLAGSERQSRTNAQGQTLQEAKHINQSLSQLGNVISALTTGAKSHIPYRNSVLTKLLADSLGGNTRTALVANLSPAKVNFDESLSTLRFASRVKLVKNDPVVNEDPKDMRIKLLEGRVRALSQANKQSAARIEELTEELACYSGSDDLTKSHKAEIARMRKAHAAEASRLRQDIEIAKTETEDRVQEAVALQASKQRAVEISLEKQEAAHAAALEEMAATEASRSMSHQAALESMSKEHASIFHEKEKEMETLRQQALEHASAIEAWKSERVFADNKSAEHAALVTSQASEHAAQIQKMKSSHDDALHQAQQEAEKFHSKFVGEEERARSLGRALAAAETLHADSVAAHKRGDQSESATIAKLETANRDAGQQVESLAEQLAAVEASQEYLESSHATDLASIESTHATAVAALEAEARRNKDAAAAQAQEASAERAAALEALALDHSKAMEALQLQSKTDNHPSAEDLQSKLSNEEQRVSLLAQESTKLQEALMAAESKSSEASLVHDREREELEKRISNEEQRSDSLQEQLIAVKALLSDTESSQQTQSMLHDAEVLRESSQAAEREKNMRARLEAATESLQHLERSSARKVSALKEQVAEANSSLTTLETMHKESTAKKSKEIESLMGDVTTLTAAHMHAVQKWMAGVHPSEYVLKLEEEKRHFKETLDETNRMHAEVCDHLRAVIEKREQEIEEEKKNLFERHVTEIDAIKLEFQEQLGSAGQREEGKP